jgi:hypothetical protein
MTFNRLQRWESTIFHLDRVYNLFLIHICIYVGGFHKKYVVLTCKHEKLNPQKLMKTVSGVDYIPLNFNTSLCID